MAKLGDVLNVRRGTTITKKDTVEGDVPVIGGGTKPTYFHNKPNREDGCITISGSGASAGYVNMWSMPIHASDCSTVEPKDNKHLKSFIFYFLKAQQDFIYKNFRSGAAQPHVYAKDIARLDYPILPLPEQKRIVAKLDKAFAEIDRSIKVSKLSELSIIHFKNALLKKQFLGNEEEKLGSLCSLITRGITPKYIENGGVKVINQKCIRNHEIDYSLARNHNYNLKIVREERFIKKGDVLVNSTGVGTLGRVAQVRQEPHERTTVDSHVTIIRPQEGLFFLDFFGYALIMIENQLQDAGQGAGGQTELSKNKVSNDFYISYPSSFEEQEQIVKILDKLNVLTSSYKKNLIKKGLQLNLLKSAILKKELQSEAA